jgi:hypothetical protein
MAEVLEAVKQALKETNNKIDEANKLTNARIDATSEKTVIYIFFLCGSVSSSLIVIIKNLKYPIIPSFHVDRPQRYANNYQLKRRSSGNCLLKSMLSKRQELLLAEEEDLLISG